MARAHRLARDAYKSVAPDASIMPVKVLGEDGGTFEEIAAGIRYAADQGADAEDDDNHQHDGQDAELTVSVALTFACLFHLQTIHIEEPEPERAEGEAVVVREVDRVGVRPSGARRLAPGARDSGPPGVGMPPRRYAVAEATLGFAGANRVRRAVVWSD